VACAGTPLTGTGYTSGRWCRLYRWCR